MKGDLEILGTRPRGRPSLYDAAHCGRVLELGAEGCCKAEIAAALGVACSTLDAWGSERPEFREALRRARDLEYAWWLKAGREGQFTKNWNLASWEVQMRSRFGKRFAGRAPTRQQRSPEPKDSTNAERIREEIERKLSRIAEAGAAEGISRQPDAPGAQGADL
jgi:hypothetical protein